MDRIRRQLNLDRPAGLAAPCREFVEATGEPGDVYLLHPFILVERAVLRALDRPALAFTPAAGCQELVPPRIAMRRERMAEEERRLAGRAH